MCISAVVETEPEKLADHFQIRSHLVASGGTSPTRRVEASDVAWTLRLGSAGRLHTETMAFNPYTVSRDALGGDLWASSLVSSNHGLIVIKGFSDWVDARILVAGGYISALDIHCAFNRSRSRLTSGKTYAHYRSDPNDRLLLVNFTPVKPMLVPVLFDEQKQAGVAQTTREFIIVSDEPPRALAQLGLSYAPLSLQPEAALEWLHSHDMDLDSVYFEEVLAARRPEALALSLYKSA